MATYDLPEDLLAMKRDLLAAQARLEEIGNAIPAPIAVAAREAEISDEQRTEWWAVHEESMRLSEEIHRHPWWGQVDNRHDAWAHLQKIAKGG